MAISNSNDRFNGYVASLAFKAPVVRQTNVNQTLSGDPGAIDGYTWTGGERILLRGQTDQTENGIWIVDITSAWQRAPDFDGNRDVTLNTLVVAHTSGEPSLWRVSSPTTGAIVVGTTAIGFQQYFSGVSSGPGFGTGGSAGRVTFWEDFINLGGDADFTVAFDPNVLTFVGTVVGNTITAVGAGGVNIENSTPALWLDDTDAGVNLTTWVVRNSDGQFIIATASDDRISTTTAFSLSRSGTDPIEALFNGMNVRITGGSLYFQEIANAPGDLSGSGQYWVRTGAPNEPMFTNEDGSDQLIDPSVSEIVAVTASRNLVLSDKGKTISFSGAVASQIMTIPANSSVAYPIGTFLGFDNSGSVDIQVAITTDTLTWADDGTTGTRTIAAGGYAVAQKVAATAWKIAGKQIT